MACPNCAFLMKKYSLLIKEMAMRHGNEMAMLQKAYAVKPDKKTAALAVLERDKLKNENKKLSEKVHNISRKLTEIKKTLKQKEAYVQVLLRLLEKNALKKEIDKHIRAYKVLEEQYKHETERYEDMNARWSAYCDQLTREKKTIKEQLEKRCNVLEADNEQLSHIVQKYKTKERDFVLENKGFKMKNVWKMDDAEKESLSDTKDLLDDIFFINRIEDDEKNPFIKNNNQLDKNNIVNHNDIQDINNNDNELNNVSDLRSDIYKDGRHPYPGK